MTLNHVEVDCSHVFRAGQIAVAIGRVKSKSGLRIVNFRKQLCFQQPKRTIIYVDSPTMPPEPTITCCQKKLHVGPVPNENQMEEIDIVSDVFNFESPSEMEEPNTDRGTDSATNPQLFVCGPCPIDVEQVIKSNVYKTPKTQMQREINHLFERLMGQYAAENFVNQQWVVVSDIIQSEIPREAHTISENVSSKILSKWKMYVTESKSYKDSVNKLFGMDKPVQTHFHVAHCLAVSVRKELIKRKASSLLASKPSKQTVDVTRRSQSSDAVVSKIRYVGAFCVAKLLFRYRSQLRRYMNSVSTIPAAKYTRCKVSIQLLEQLTVPELEILETTEFEASLMETVERQNIRHSLTHVSDKAFLFFKRLCEETVPMENAENLNIYGGDLFTFITTSVKKDMNIYSAFCSIYSAPVASNEPDVDSSVQGTIASLLSDIVNQVDIMMEVYEEIILLFTRVLHVQFRRDYLTALKSRKKDAHRKEIQKAKIQGETETAVKQVKTTTITKDTTIEQHEITMTEIKADTSPHLQLSHSRLKNKLNDTPKYLQGHKFTKNDLFQLCGMYNVPHSSKATKLVLANALYNHILSCDEIPHPEVITGRTMPSPSPQADPTPENDPNACTVCHLLKGSQWIQCDKCDKWYHRVCANLTSAKDWRMYAKTDKAWICQSCL